MRNARKYLSLLLALCLAAGAVGCQQSAPAIGDDQAAANVSAEPAPTSGPEVQDTLYTPGTYEGIGQGMGGDLHVSVTFDENSITAVEIGENAETPLISQNALERIPSDIVAYQSLAVDSVTGATVTSAAVLSAVADAVTLAGGDAPALQAAEIPASEKLPDEEISVDVLVVGGGLSGMTAAYETASAGKNTLIIEKLEAWGGSSARSGGAVCYATNEDDPTGYFSAEDYYKWFQNMGHGQINDKLVKEIAYRSNETVQWMRNTIGYNPPYEMVETFVDGTVGRLTNPGSPTEYVTGMGGSMMKIFYDKLCSTENLTMLNQTKAEALLTDDTGAVTGVQAVRPDGSTLTIRAKATVLATGGWAHSSKYRQQWAPGMEKAIDISGVGCDGDGIGFCEAVGAKITSDTPCFAGGVYGPLAAAPSNFLLVNGNGKRFLAEDAPSATVFNAMMRDETGVFYLVFDHALAGENYDGSAEMVFKADTVRELAEQIGIPADALAATVDRYNELAGGEDADFGKAAELMTGLGEGPYYAVGVATYILTAYAGPDITENCEVIREDGSIIPGLYGVGELIATNIMGYDDGGHGSSLQYDMSTGRIAAASVIDYIG